ncbi:MAG: hypothetical protein Q8N44_19835 [Rubrivivax sp.]|nr:hypothetical protein [Rubrivivax sp.]
MSLEELIYEKEAALARAEAADPDWDQAKEVHDQTKVETAKQAMSDELDRYDEYNRRVGEIRTDIRDKARRAVEAARAAAEAELIKDVIEKNPAPDGDVGGPRARRLFGTLGPARTAEELRAKLRRL